MAVNLRRVHRAAQRFEARLVMQVDHMRQVGAQRLGFAMNLLHVEPAVLELRVHQRVAVDDHAKILRTTRDAVAGAVLHPGHAALFDGIGRAVGGPGDDHAVIALLVDDRAATFSSVTQSTVLPIGGAVEVHSDQ